MPTRRDRCCDGKEAQKLSFWGKVLLGYIQKDLSLKNSLQNTTIVNMGLPVKKRYGVTLLKRETPKYFTSEEVRAILAQIKNPRDHLIVNMLWRTGARVSELLAIRVSDIDLYSKVIRLMTLKQKGSKPLRYVPIIEDNDGIENPTPFQDEIESYISKSNLSKDELLFKVSRQYVHQVIVRACKKAGLDRERAHAHTFRHSFAVNCIMKQIPPAVVQRVLGHADPTSTALYMNILASDLKMFFGNIRKW